MSQWIDHLTLFDWTLLAAAGIGLIGLILALLTPAGREALALLGLRLADALVKWLEQQLSEEKRQLRRR